MHGSVVFYRVAGKWQAVAAAPAASSVGVFRARRGGAVFVWTMPDIEGPGQQFDGLSMSARGSGRFCTRLPFPKALNTPQWQAEFLELAGFNVDSSGVATLIGTANVERDVVPATAKKKRKAKPKRQQVTLVYRYSSRDGGRRWSLPQPASVVAPTGRYDRITRAPTDLIASLRAQVR